MLVLMSVAVVLGTWGYGVWTTRQASLALPIFALSTLFFVAGVGVPALAARERCLRRDEQEWCTELRSDLSKALKDVDDPLRGLAELNFKQMRVFTTEAIRQARRAAYACFAAAWVSLVVLVLGAAGAMIAKGTDARISATVLAAIGACLSTFITHVFVKSYLVAARQMSYYYGQPLVQCYLLHAERLASSFGSDSGDRLRWQLVQQVMSAALGAAKSAQMICSNSRWTRVRVRRRNSECRPRTTRNRRGHRPAATCLSGGWRPVRCSQVVRGAAPTGVPLPVELLLISLSGEKPAAPEVVSRPLRVLEAGGRRPLRRFRLENRAAQRGTSGSAWSENSSAFCDRESVCR
jgi:hypothetical protein